jgi:hypothetical protein
MSSVETLQTNARLTEISKPYKASAWSQPLTVVRLNGSRRSVNVDKITLVAFTG